MNTTMRTNPFVRATVAGFAALTIGVTAAGCSETTGDEEGTSVGDIQEEDAAGANGDEISSEADDGTADDDLAYDGIYDSGFYAELDSYEGEQVTVSAEVEEIVSEQSFTIAGDDVEALLIVGADDTSELQPGSSVEVTGTVSASFDLPTIEEQLGEDLDDEVFADYDQEPYVTAEEIDTSLDEAEDDDV